jgi:hypothetical protein
MPHGQRSLERGPTQIEIAVLQAQVLARQLLAGKLGDREGRSRTAVEDLHLLRLDLDVAGRQLWVVLARQAFADLPLDGQDEFGANLLGRLEQMRMVCLEDDLGDAIAIAEVDEHLIVVAAVRVDPAVEYDRVADVTLAQFTAIVRPLPVRHFRLSLTQILPSRVYGQRRL